MSNTLAKQISDFVDSQKLQQTVEWVIDYAKKQGATDCQVSTSSALGLNVTVRQHEIDTVEFNRGKALGITVYIGQRKGSASTNDLTNEALKSTIEAALHIAKYTEEDPFAGLANQEELAFEYPDLKLYYPWSITAEEAIDLAKECEQAAFDSDKRISNSEGASLSTYQSFQVMGNSKGFIGGYPTSMHSLTAVLIAQDQNGMQRDYDYTTSRNPQELISPKIIGVNAAARTVRRLSPRTVKTQRVNVVFEAQAAKSLLSHFLSAVSGGNLFRKTSFLTDALNKEIFNPIIQIKEYPHLLGALGSSPFDQDGVVTREKDFIVNGVLKSYALSAYSARKLKMVNTGNSGGVCNLMVTPTAGALSSLLQQLGTGLLVTELMGQGVNIVTGDYSRGVSGYWVENGEVQFPVSEITIAGNLKDMFKNMVSVGNDIDKRGNILTGSVLVEGLMLAGES